MGMILCLRTVSDDTLDHLLDEPEAIIALLDDEVVEDDGNISDEGISADLDKAWHAIHYLLTGTAWEGQGPEAFLLAGGKTIGEVDVGYGPARGFSARDTREIAAALDQLPHEFLATRFDGATLDAAEIYPEIWARDGNEGLAYITEYYDSLRSFVATAVRKKMGMLVFIT